MLYLQHTILYMQQQQTASALPLTVSHFSTLAQQSCPAGRHSRCTGSAAAGLWRLCVRQPGQLQEQALQAHRAVRVRGLPFLPQGQGGCQHSGHRCALLPLPTRRPHLQA